MTPVNRKRLFHRTGGFVLFAAVALTIVLAPISLLPAHGTLSAPLVKAENRPTWGVYTELRAPRILPGLPAASPNDPIPGENYPETWLNPPPTDRPAAAHPDLNLIVRGYTCVNESKDWTFYYGNTDEGAPQLCGLFGDDRLPTIKSVYRVYDWQWGAFERGKTIHDPAVTLIGVDVTPGEIIYLPSSGYTIGEGFNAVVLYADPKRLTIKFTREDNVVSGYTLHLENICPEPRLLGVYENCNNNARGHLPALYSGHALGRACGDELGIAIRDNGDFMDPRSSKDWWRK